MQRFGRLGIAGRVGRTSAAAGAVTAVLFAMASFAPPASAKPAGVTYQVTQILSGMSLHHSYQPAGSRAWHSEPLTQPDDITRVGGDLFTGFQNGVGPQGQASTDGNRDSTIVEFTQGGRVVNQWDVRGKCDGLTANPATGLVIATVDEDANSSLYAINSFTNRVTQGADTAFQQLWVLHLSNSVDDTAWANTAFGAFFAADHDGDTIDRISGFWGTSTILAAVTPCDANGAPATCPGPGFLPNYVGSLNPWTGQLTPVTLSGPKVEPQGMIFVPS